MYSERLLEHFYNPKNVGDVDAPDAAAEVENPACGDRMRLSLRIESARIVEARFRTQGCVAAIACGSALTELLSGKSVEEAGSVSREEVVAAVGGLPNESTHASHLAMDALTAALASNTKLTLPADGSR